MRCPDCDAKWHVTTSQPGPGGSSSPRAFLVLSACISVASGAMWMSEAPLSWTLSVLGAAFMTMVVCGLAMCDCAGGIGDPGNLCPECGRQVPIRPWSH